MSQPQRKYCPSGKALWPTRKMALGSANVTAARHGLPLRVYKCGACHHWHLTKQQEAPPHGRKGILETVLLQDCH